MTAESVFDLPVKTYFTPDGEPTCAIDFNSGQVCKFLILEKFGMAEVCLFNLGVWLDRRGDRKTGYLIPGDRCPIGGKS